MAHGPATTTRPAALAGFFYPADPAELRTTVAGFLAPDTDRNAIPKAIIVPHAGYIYSGAVAGAAYERLRRGADAIGRVVLLGPTHRVYVRGMAAPTVTHFATPLGDMVIDRAAIAALKDLPQVEFNDEAHAAEHSIEVQLPFLQKIAPRAMLVPVAVGDTTPDAVAEVLERFWDDPETLIVISSDLSHFHAYGDAQRRDLATAECIESFAGEDLHGERACGFLPIAGVLAAAKRHGATIERLALRNSGDSAGPRDRVVGYGAWAIYEAS